jgi:hypothetical protein
MGIPLITGLLDTIGGAIDTVADKIAPDKNIQIQTDADLQKFKLQLKAGLEMGAIWKKLDNVDIRTAHIEGALKLMGNLTVNQQE